VDKTDISQWGMLIRQTTLAALVSALTAYIAMALVMNELKVNVTNLIREMSELNTRIKDHEVLQFRVTRLEMQVEHDGKELRDGFKEHNEKVEQLFLLMQRKEDKAK
jgi:hypothetical protein